MKQLLTTLLMLAFTYTANAQFGKNNAIYTTGELQFGNYSGIDVSYNYVYKEKYSVKAAYSAVFRTPRSQPTDFSPGVFNVVFFGLRSVYDQMENYQVTVGEIFKLNERGTTRYNLAIGIGYTTIREPENWQKVDKQLFVRNYTWDYKKSNTISVIINPKIEFPFTRYYGLTISPMLQLNKQRTYFGVGFGHMMGLLRGKIAKPQTTN